MRPVKAIIDNTRIEADRLERGATGLELLFYA